MLFFKGHFNIEKNEDSVFRCRRLEKYGLITRASKSPINLKPLLIQTTQFKDQTSAMVKCNLFEFSLSTGVSFNEAKLMGLASSQGTGPMPRDMSFPVPKGGSWHDLYDYIKYGYFTREQKVHNRHCFKSPLIHVSAHTKF